VKAALLATAEERVGRYRELLLELLVLLARVQTDGRGRHLVDTILVVEGQEQWVEEYEVAAATGRDRDWSGDDAEGFSDFSSEDSLEENSDQDDPKEVEEHDVKREVGDAVVENDVESVEERGTRR